MGWKIELIVVAQARWTKGIAAQCSDLLSCLLDWAGRYLNSLFFHKIFFFTFFYCLLGCLPAHLTDCTILILNPHMCCSLKKPTLCISYGLHHINCWNKTLPSYKTASFLLKIVSSDMIKTSIFYSWWSAWFQSQQKHRMLLEIILLEHAQAVIVLTLLWSYSPLKCASQKSSYRSMFSKQLHIWSSCHVNSQKKILTAQLETFYCLFRSLKESWIYKWIVLSIDSLLFQRSPALLPVEHESVIFTLKPSIVSILLIFF